MVGTEKMESKESGATILLQRYRMAVELYRHEDELNWRKMGGLLFLTGGLISVLGILNQRAPTHGLSQELLWSISLFGCISAIGFAFAIWSGVDFMIKRKQLVREIENALPESLTMRIVTNNELPSISTYVLRWFPILIALGWLLVPWLMQ